MAGKVTIPFKQVKWHIFTSLPHTQQCKVAYTRIPTHVHHSALLESQSNHSPEYVTSLMEQIKAENQTTLQQAIQSYVRSSGWHFRLLTINICISSAILISFPWPMAPKALEWAKLLNGVHNNQELPISLFTHCVETHTCHVMRVSKITYFNYEN
jgi:CRISPR/Cas system endoribonuclease Cas6 (RAMP superfamily)